MVLHSFFLQVQKYLQLQNMNKLLQQQSHPDAFLWLKAGLVFLFSQNLLSYHAFLPLLLLSVRVRPCSLQEHITYLLFFLNGTPPIRHFFPLWSVHLYWCFLYFPFYDVSFNLSSPIFTSSTILL